MTNEWQPDPDAAPLVVVDPLYPRGKIVGMLAGFMYYSSRTGPYVEPTPEELKTRRLAEVEAWLDDGDTIDDVVYVDTGLRGDFYTHRNVYVFDNDYMCYRCVSRNPPEVKP